MYPKDVLQWDQDDDGTMPENVNELRQAVVGHRIVFAQKGIVPVPWGWRGEVQPRNGFVITLDNGEMVLLADTSDCSAFTELEAFLLHPELVDHIITGVGTTNGYEKWHIHADAGDVLELTVGWSSGNPFYYGYGFDIYVVPLDTHLVPQALTQ